MNSTMTIRDFVVSDLDAVHRLNIEAFNSHADQAAIDELTSRAQRDLFDIGTRFADGALLVGVVGEELVAMAATRRIETATFEMNYVRVDRAHQRRGYGRRIVTAIEERARSLGGRLMVLDTTVQQVAARSLYESLGYRLSGRRVLKNEHGKFELVVYEKQIEAIDLAKGV